MDLRLLLISHAATAAQRAGRLPGAAAGADPLDVRGIADTEAARARLGLPDNVATLTSPAACARETATALGLVATMDQGLADINYGRWHGQKLIDIANAAPQDLAAWTSDPAAAPHGGESFSQLVSRVGRWLDTLDAAATDTHPSRHQRNIVAITHVNVLRAALIHALGASPTVFSRIEIAPLSAVELRRSLHRGWTWWPASG